MGEPTGEVEVAVERWLDHDLDEVGVTRLRQVLDDPAALAEARAQIVTHHLLVEGARSDEAVAAAWAVCAGTLSPPRQERVAQGIQQRLWQRTMGPRRRWPTIVASAAGIIVVITAVIGLLTLRTPAVEWRSDDGVRAVVAGTTLTAPEKTTAELRWRDGSRWVLQPGTEVVVQPDADHRLALTHGQVHAAVMPQREPAVVRTPQGSATVLGTEFTLASDAGGTWLSVQHGRVRLGDDSRTIDVAAGDVAELTKTGVRAVTPWSDPRPIGVWILANVRHPPGNPAGWFSDPQLDVTTAAGRERFTARVEAETTRVIAALTAHGAQGVLIWDIEGSHPRAPIYPGDPRLLPDLAPEMDALADQVFTRLRAAGFSTGVRLGVHPWRRLDDGRLEIAAGDGTNGQEAIERARYAHQRWGCTLFFLGHNLTRAGFAAYQRTELDEARHATSPAIISAIQRAIPGSLVIPEYAAPGTWAIAPVLTSTDAASLARWRSATTHWPHARPALLSPTQPGGEPTAATAVRAAGGLVLVSVTGAEP